MEGSTELDFLAALGQEFCAALSPPVPEDRIVPQDGFEVLKRAFGVNPTPDYLASLTDADVEHLRSVCADYFECPAVSEVMVRLAVSRTLARWPARRT